LHLRHESQHCSVSAGQNAASRMPAISRLKYLEVDDSFSAATPDPSLAGRAMAITP
jgi:hypothetical protein